jgi:transposase-like protein
VAKVQGAITTRRRKAAHYPTQEVTRMDADRLLAITIRRALRMIVRAIEKRYNLKEAATAEVE